MQLKLYRQTYIQRNKLRNDFCNNDVQILDSENKVKVRLILEIVYIKKHDTTLSH